MFKSFKNEKLPKRQGRYYDYKLLMVIMILSCFGLIMVYSSSAYTASSEHGDASYFLKRQLIISAVSFGIMIWVSKVNYHGWLRLTPVAYFGSLICMLLVDFSPLGVELNGKKRWLQVIPGIDAARFQPTELVKLAIIMTMAALMTRYIKRKTIDLLGSMMKLIIMGLPLIGFVGINNLSSGIIIVGIPVIMYFVASRHNKLYLFIVAAIAVTLFVSYNFIGVIEHFLHSYQFSRIEVWVDPMSDPTGDGYQVLQGLYAIGSGGLLGKGLGNSIQKLGFLPESYNDMVFSVICEELGLFGAVCLMILFAYMIYRFVYIACRAPDEEGLLLVTGVMAHISLQVLLNIAVVTNTIPNTGVTLPFISYGGTSVVFLMAEMGLVLSVSNQIIYER